MMQARIDIEIAIRPRQKGNGWARLDRAKRTAPPILNPSNLGRRDSVQSQQKIVIFQPSSKAS